MVAGLHGIMLLAVRLGLKKRGEEKGPWEKEGGEEKGPWEKERGEEKGPLCIAGSG